MTTISQTIPSLGSPPLTSDPSNFDTRADTLYGTSLPAVITAVNTWAGQANTVAGEVNTDKLAAAASAVAAAADAVIADNAAQSAVSAPGTEATSTTSNSVSTGSKTFTIQTGKAYSVGQSLVIANTAAPATNWMFGQITAHNSGTGSITINVTRAEGSGTLTAWTLSISANPQTTQPPSEIVRVARTSNTAIDSTNKSNLIDITSGTFTQTFNSASSLGNGWFCYIRNSGTGIITLDPNASETINGSATLTLWPQSTAQVQCNGSNLFTASLQSASTGSAQVLLSSTTVSSPVASVDFIGINSTYDQYVVEVLNAVPENDVVFLRMRTSTNNGSSYDSGASDYKWIQVGGVIQTTDHIGFATGSIGSDTDENGVSGTVKIVRPSQAAKCQVLIHAGWVLNDGDPRQAVIFGFRDTAADVDAVRFLFSAGNIESGIFNLYGIRKS